MPVDWIRGFRRIGWVITFPLAATIVYAFWDRTEDIKEVIVDVGAIAPYINDHPSVWYLDNVDPALAGLPLLSAEERDKIREEQDKRLRELRPSPDVFDRIALPDAIVEAERKERERRLANIPEAQKKAFELLREQRIQEIRSLLEEEGRSGKTPRRLSELERLGGPGLKRDYVVIRRVNPLKLIALVLGSITVVALITQGSISVLAWVFRGFKG